MLVIAGYAARMRVPSVTPILRRAWQTTAARSQMIKRSSSPDGRETKQPSEDDRWIICSCVYMRMKNFCGE